MKNKKTMAWAAGIDIGSAFSKAVIVSGDGTIFYHVIASRGDYKGAAQKVMEEVLRKAGLKPQDIDVAVATGIGAANVPFPSQHSAEIACQARGTKYLFPSARTIIDIGDQASRVIKVDKEGRPTNFVVSERCAAGSGRFLQVMARVLHVDVSEIGELSLKSKKPVTFGTNCAVFAESEAISRVAEGASKEDILAGIHIALAAKIHSMVERVGLEKDCVMTGGGAKDIGLVKSLEREIGGALLVPTEPYITGALGAWVIAHESSMARQPESLPK